MTDYRIRLFDDSMVKYFDEIITANDAREVAAKITQLLGVFSSRVTAEFRVQKQP